jgi:autotransporter-associated beta strand protein
MPELAGSVWSLAVLISAKPIRPRCSSGTSGSNGILQLNGATINSVANTLIRVAGSANLTIADVNTGSGSQTMGLRLGSTDGILEVATGRTLTISSIISEATSNSGFTKTGAGTLVLTRANTFSGPVAHNGGIINITNASALGTGGVVTKTSTSTGTLTLTGTNTYTGGTNLNGGALSLSNGSAAGTGAITIGTGATSGTGGSVSTILVNNTAATTLANNIALAAPNAATTYTLMKATASASTGTQLNLTGDISGGNANSTFRLNSNTAGDNTTTYRLAGNNSFQGNLELYRGAIVVTNDNSLGSAKLLLNGNNNATLGDLRFENSVTLAMTSTSSTLPIQTRSTLVATRSPSAA